MGGKLSGGLLKTAKTIAIHINIIETSNNSAHLTDRCILNVK